LPREGVLSRIHGASRDVAARLQGTIDDLNLEIHDFLCHSRVICVSEYHDNVVMWSHYADGHRGVVFALNFLEEMNHPLSCARKVTYTDEFIAFPSAEQYAMHLTGEAPIDLTSLCWNIAFTKHRDWSYEHEWRVHLPLLDEPPGDGFTLYQETPAVFESIYLGCQMGPRDQETIVSHARRHLPRTRIYRARRSNSSFTLEFEEIPG
jgi:hypothetical protein